MTDTTTQEVNQEADLKDYIITRYSLLNQQVCTRLEKDALLDAMRASGDFVSGTTAGWVLSDRENCQPVQCEKYPNRMHYLFDC